VGATLTKTIDRLIRDSPPEVLRAAAIRSWLGHHPAATAHIMPDGQTSKYLHCCDESEVATLGASIEVKTLKEIEAIFERIIESGRRKKQGAVYTPNHIIDFLVAEVCRKSTQLNQLKFLDPACGSGGFLIRAAAHLASRFGVSIEQAFADHIVGVDNDADALEHAACLVELFGAHESTSIERRVLRLYCLDSLLVPAHDLLRLLDAPSGFDALATNPPYVKLQNLDPGYREQLAATYPEFAQFNFSLALLFLVAGRRLLASGGTLGYITQNNLFTSFAGEPVRRALQQERSLRRIIDFGHHKVFKDVLAYTCLLFLDNDEHDAIEFARIEKEVSLADLAELSYSKVPVAKLNPRKWRLARPTDLRNLKTIETTGTPLGRLAEIRVGFATLKDKIFFVDESGPYCRARHPETLQEYRVETALTQPAVRVSDVSSEGLDAAARRVVFPYRRAAGRYVLIPEDELRAEYPEAYRYLSACRRLLESRDKGKRSYQAWYAWGRTQGQEAPGPKLLTKTFNTRPEFFLDPTDRLFCNGYGVFAPRRGLFYDDLSISALKVILESCVMQYYAKLTTFQIDGNFQCYQKNFIEHFGIPNISPDVQRQLTRVSPRDADHIICDLYGVGMGEIYEALSLG
jgi:hypothetical protein